MAKVIPDILNSFTRLGLNGCPAGVLNDFVLEHPLLLEGTPVVDADEYRALILSDNPLAYYRLAEESGLNVIDEMGNHHGTYPTADEITQGQIGLITQPNKSVFLPSSFVNYINVGTLGDWGSALGTGAAIEFWFKLDPSVGAQPGFMSTDVLANAGLPWDATPELHMWYQKVGPRIFLQILGIGAGQVRIVPPAEMFEDFSVHHLVWNIQGNSKTYECYIDSVSYPVNTTFMGTFPGTPFAANIWLGRGGGPYIFDGFLDEFAIYEHTLTAAQVLAHYNAGIAAQGTTLDGKAAHALTLNSRAAESKTLNGVAAATLTQNARSAQSVTLDGVAAGSLTLDTKADNL